MKVKIKYNKVMNETKITRKITYLVFPNIPMQE